MTVFAHIGHVLVDLPLFGGPVLLLGVALWVSALRHRRSSASSDRASPHP